MYNVCSFVEKLQGWIASQ